MARVKTLQPRVGTAKISRTAPLSTAPARIANNSTAHQAIKRMVAKRSGGWCECTACRLSGAPLPAEQFDHLIPLWEGGTNDLGNWQHLNGDCHKAKSAAETRRRMGLEP